MRIASGLLPGHVLQRTPKGASATITGTSDGAGAVTATISAGRKPLRGWAAKKVGTAAGGVFRVTLAGIPTGGPYNVTLAVGKERTVVPEVFVGDLWLMAGQSNMEGVGNLSDAPKPHPLVRNFDMDHRWSIARDPLHHLPESPDVVHNNGHQQSLENREKAKRTKLKGTGVGVYFGTDMHARTGVPQGLIATAHGGTSMEQWDPAKKGLGGASLYGSMLSSLRDVGQPVAGVLWYQGCSETNPAAAAVYTERMKKLVAAVRADLKQPKLPWITVQISKVVTPHGGEKEWNSIQEQQRKLPAVIKLLETVPAIDLQMDDLVHIGGKAYAILAKRMARAAARLVLGDRKEIPAITFAKIVESRHQPLGPTIEVHFANVVGGLQSPGLPFGFSLVDRAHQPVDVIYKTVLEGDKAVLHVVNRDQPDLGVMYGWGKNPACNVTDARGMAVPVLGPVWLGKGEPLSPWLLTWDMSGVHEGEDIGAMARPTRATAGVVEHRTWTPNFINNHELWQHASGHVMFFGAITLAEPMELELRTGYDGPIRLWIGEDELLKDLKGTNPAVIDKERRKLGLPAGTHQITVLMALNGGKAWGFFLRFARRKVTPAQIKAGNLPLPVPMT